MTITVHRPHEGAAEIRRPNRENTPGTERGGSLSPDAEALIQSVARQCREAGSYVRPRRLRELYLLWSACAETDWEFGAFVFNHLDRTGDRATHNVLRGDAR